MALGQKKYIRILAFLTLILCSPTHLWAAGPFVWCMGPHDQAVIEHAATDTHHNGHHHDTDDQGTGPGFHSDNAHSHMLHNEATQLHGSHDDLAHTSDMPTHDDGDKCIDLELAHDGYFNSIDGLTFAPNLIETPFHLAATYQAARPGFAITGMTRAPPDIHLSHPRPHSLTAKSVTVLLI